MDPRKHRRQPPLWLCVGLPITLFLATISLYKQEALSVAIHSFGTSLNETIVNKVSGGTSIKDTILDKVSGISIWKPVEKTIIRDVPHDEYLAVCLFARDQALDMVEFFQHHYYEIGIRRFWVMDDASDPPLSTFQNQYGIPPEAIDFVYHEKSTPVPQGAQVELNNQCGQVYGINHTWMAYIDADEFLDATGEETVEEILREFEETRPDVGAVGVNWQMHTSNHQILRAESSRQTYLECISDGDENMGENGNKHVKSFVRTDAYVSPQNPHTFNLKEGFVTVGEHGDLLTMSAFRQPITRDRLSLHHYVLKSWEDYYDKTSRSEKDWTFWDYMEYQTPHVACAQMLKYFPKALNQPNPHKRTRHDKKPF